jgi:hypothetical protein
MSPKKLGRVYVDFHFRTPIKAHVVRRPLLTASVAACAAQAAVLDLIEADVIDDASPALQVMRLANQRILEQHLSPLLSAGVRRGIVSGKQSQAMRLKRAATPNKIEDVLKLFDQGDKPSVIAGKLNLSLRRVSQVIAADRRMGNHSSETN